MIKRVFLFLCFFSLFLFGCNDEKDPKEELKFSVIGLTEIYVGDETTYSTTLDSSYTVVWSTSSTEIGSISQSGLLVGNKAGTIDVIATVEGFTEKLTVVIKSIEEKNYEKLVKAINAIESVDDITIESGEYLNSLMEQYNSLSLEEKALVTNIDLLNNYLDKYQQLVYDSEKNTYSFTIVGPTEISADKEVKYQVECDRDYEFVWSVSDSNIGDITNDGSFYGYSEGVVEITATIKGTTNSRKITVVITPAIIKPKNIILEGNDYLSVGESFELIVKVRPTDANEELIYELDNDCASLENNIVTALKEGTVTITVSSQDRKVKGTLVVSISDLQVNTDVKLLDGVTRDMTAYQYWTKLYSNTNDVILSLDEIEAKNKEGYTISGTKMVDILSSGTTIKGSAVKSLISSYTVNTSYRINGATQPSNYSSLLYAATNKDAVSETVNIKFGLVNSFGAMRTFPTYDVATSSNNFDRFQETGLEYGEGCLIYHESLDGKWYFVQTSNYYGWVEKQYITVVSQNEMNDYLTNESFVIVISAETNIDTIDMRMGSRIIVSEELENDYVLKLITKNGFKTFNASKNSKDLHYGYMEYTINNLLKQIFKLLGNAYRWGDSSFDGHDCSSTMNAAYHCMGFVMARNTSSQYQMPYTLHDVSSSSDAAKKNILNDLHVGSLVFVSGHVMMYLGHVGDNYYILHNFSSGGGCNISTTNLIRSGSTTYLTAFTYFLEMI